MLVASWRGTNQAAYIAGQLASETTGTDGSFSLTLPAQQARATLGAAVVRTAGSLTAGAGDGGPLMASFGAVP